MNVRNCRSCGSIFNYVAGQVICPVCREKLEKKFHEVKEYIRENKGAGIQEVSEACDVEVSQIRQWLREDRLELTEGSPIMLSCDGCGAPIRSGKYCDKCKANVSNGFNYILKSNAPKKPDSFRKKEDNGSRMRYLQ